MCKLIFNVAKVTSNEILLDINSILLKARFQTAMQGCFQLLFLLLALYDVIESSRPPEPLCFHDGGKLA